MCSFFLSREPFLRTEVPRESLWGHHQARMGSPSGGPNPSRGWGGALHGVWEVTYPSWNSGWRGCSRHAHTCSLTPGDAQLLPLSWGCSPSGPGAGRFLSPPAQLGAGASPGEGRSHRHHLPAGPVEVTEVLALKGCEHPLTHGASPRPWAQVGWGEEGGSGVEAIGGETGGDRRWGEGGGSVALCLSTLTAPAQGLPYSRFQHPL